MKIGLGFLHYSFFHHTSESTALKALGRAWIKLGHEVVFINRAKKMVNNDDLPQQFLTENRDLLPHVIDRSSPRVENLDMIFELYDYHCASRYMAHARIKTGSFVWALSPLSKFHIKWISRYRDPLFITGKQSYNEAIELGIDAHLYTIGVDHEIFNPENSNRSTDTTKFLWIGGCSVASAPDLVLRAYFQAFSRKDNVKLTMISPRNTVRRLANEMVDNRSIPVLNFISADKSPNAMAQTYRSHNALVMPIRFHGGCHPVSEAMACGTLVITTPWTGPTDYAGPDEALWIDYELENVRSSAKELEKYSKMAWFTKYFDKYDQDVKYVWARPSVEHLATLMREVHENKYDKNIVKKALKRSKSFSWSKIAADILEVLEHYV